VYYLKEILKKKAKENKNFVIKIMVMDATRKSSIINIKTYSVQLNRFYLTICILNICLNNIIIIDL
jgi:hypothetical protein